MTKRAFVTGASSGIGLATVESLVHDGWHVFGLDVTAFPKPEILAGELRCDVSDQKAVKESVAKHMPSGSGLNLVVTCVGIWGRLATIDELEKDDVRISFDVTVGGRLSVAQATLPALRAAKGSMVVWGRLQGEGALQAGAHYAGSKGAIHAIVRSLAKNEAKHGVRMNGVAPGPVLTPMIAGKTYSAAGIPLGRLAETDDVVEAIRFLASQSSSYITGTNLEVNGGVFGG